MDSQHQPSNLRWSSHHNRFVDGFKDLLKQELLVDVTLICEKQALKAHKVVLSACSSYLRQIFAENPCQHPVIILKDVQLVDLKSVLDFMYCGEVYVSECRLAKFVELAESLDLTTNLFEAMTSSIETEEFDNVPSMISPTKADEKIGPTVPENESSPLMEEISEFPKNCERNRSIRSFENFEEQQDFNNHHSNSDEVSSDITVKREIMDTYETNPMDFPFCANKNTTEINTVFRSTEQPDPSLMIGEGVVNHFELLDSKERAMQNFANGKISKRNRKPTIIRKSRQITSTVVCSDSVKMFACDICGKLFKYARSVTRHHREMHQGLEGPTCQICKKVFNAGRYQRYLAHLNICKKKIADIFVGSSELAA